MTDAATGKRGYCGKPKENKKCSADGRSSRKCKIAYWQANNYETRPCVNAEVRSIP